MELTLPDFDGIRAIIFDCDGTLVDSAPIYGRAWAAGFAAAGGAMDPDWYLARNGLSEHVLMTQYEAAFGLTLDRPGITDIVRQAFLSNITDLNEIMHVAEIARLATGVVPLAVASGGPRAIVEASLRQTDLASLFKTVVAFDDVGIAKPAPDIFLEAARRLCAEPTDCLVLEDSQTGIDGALAAGMRCIDVRIKEACRELASHLLSRLEAVNNNRV